MIVCTHYRASMLRRCLESLAAIDDPSYEVLVVDNTSGDPEAERLASEAGARYVREPRPGLSRARNAGARAAKGEQVAFLDDDAIPEPAWLERHSAALADPRLAATTGRILPISPHGTTGPVSALAQLLDLGNDAFAVDYTTPSWFELANFGGLGLGGNMAFRRSLFEDGFRFRESLGAGAVLQGGEELYAFFTLIREGHRVAYVPDAVVRHGEPTTPTEQKAEEIAGARRYSAYLSMLFVEEPEFRLRTARYIAEALRRPRRPWRRVEPQAREANRLRVLLAACGGPLLYLRSRLRSARGAN